MRYLVLFFLFFGISLTTQAQVYEISISEHKLQDPIRNITIEQIIDLRYVQSTIGWVQTGLGNKKVQADFEENFTSALQTFIINNSINAGQSIPVIMKVNKFLISEKTELDREYATADISFEFLAKKDNGYFKIIDATSVIKISSGLDVTDKHPENIVNALDECFTKLSAIDIFDKIKIKTAEVLTEDYLRVNNYYKVSELNLPILKATNLNEGIYSSFQEFVNNAPGSTTKPQISIKDALHLTSLGNELDGVWGFSDGKQAYIFVGNNHFPITRKDDFFTFSAPTQTVNSNAVLAGSIIGGVAGGLLAYAILTKNEEIEFVVNMVTGKIVHLQDYNPQASLTNAAQVIFYRKTKNESREKLEVYVNDSLIAQLAPFTFTELKLKYPLSEMEFCLKAQDKKCINFRPEIDETYYIECSLPKKANAKPELTQTSKQKATYILDLIKKYQDRPSKN